MIVIMSFKLPVHFGSKSPVSLKVQKDIPMNKGLHDSRDAGKLLFEIRRKDFTVCESINQNQIHTGFGFKTGDSE